MVEGRLAGVDRGLKSGRRKGARVVPIGLSSECEHELAGILLAQKVADGMLGSNIEANAPSATAHALGIERLADLGPTFGSLRIRFDRR